MSFRVIVDRQQQCLDNSNSALTQQHITLGPKHGACRLQQRVSLVQGSMAVSFPQGVGLHAAVIGPQHCLPVVMLGEMLSGVLRMSARPCSPGQQQTFALAHTSQLDTTNSCGSAMARCPTATK